MTAEKSTTKSPASSVVTLLITGAATSAHAVCFFSPTAKDTWKMFAVEPDIYA